MGVLLVFVRRPLWAVFRHVVEGFSRRALWILCRPVYYNARPFNARLLSESRVVALPRSVASDVFRTTLTR